MERPHVLVIDDSNAIRKTVECHLSQAGYRISQAADAEKGLSLAASAKPDLILLDHQLPGTTGDQVCRKLWENPATNEIPVLISSSLRLQVMHLYTEFPNAIDSLPKPYTPDNLKSAVANALTIGPKIIQAAKTGGSIEDVNSPPPALLSGNLEVFPARAVLDFVNNCKITGRLSFEVEGGLQIRFCVAGGRIQAVYSPNAPTEEVARCLPEELSDLAPLLTVTLTEQRDPQMGGLVNLLQKSLSDPRRLRALLRAQAAILTYGTLHSRVGEFALEPLDTPPPMFQAFPLQTSLPALAVEGVRRCADPIEADSWASLVFARQTRPGANLDRAGLNPVELKIHTLFDGAHNLAAVAQAVGVHLAEVAAVAQGLELTGLVERRDALANAHVMVLEDDTEAVRLIQRVLGPEGMGFQLKIVRDRIGASLLLRRTKFDLIIMALDTPEQEAFLRQIKQNHPETRFIGLAGMPDDESELTRFDQLGLDHVLHRPLSESDLVSTIRHVLGGGQLVGAGPAR